MIDICDTELRECLINIELIQLNIKFHIRHNLFFDILTFTVIAQAYNCVCAMIHFWNRTN